VESNSRRLADIESGAQKVVGVNCFTESADSPLLVGADGGFLSPDAEAERDQIEQLSAWRGSRDSAAAMRALDALRAAAREGNNIMEPSIACAHAGVTTGEWSQVLREIYGEYRAPTGVGRAASSGGATKLAELRASVERVSQRLGRRLKMLVGKPGLDGHSNGAEQIAVRARDAGFEVVYEGIRLTPAQIANAALEEGVHVVGLSILSGSHVALVGDVLTRLKNSGLAGLPVVVGGIIPPEDASRLMALGVARVYTPKNFDLNAILADVVDVVDQTSREAA
jgi:(2R)-ethylmalonyl-CoA mutase